MNVPAARIDLVSPLPPVRSGIADYSADLLPHLAARAALRVVQLPDQPPVAGVPEEVPVVEVDRFGEDGRLPLYQMGNNRYHMAVHDLALRLPGVLTLHDIVLHHFLIDRTVQQGYFHAYQRQLTAEHGWIGAAAALPLRWAGGSGNAAQFSLPAHRTLLARQRGVLVHSRWAAAWLAEEEIWPEESARRVRAVPMGVPLPPAVAAADGLAFRQRYGLPTDRPLLGSFGFQTPIKRTDVAIRALAAPALADVHLLVAGEVAQIYELEVTARQAGVAERVHFLGFLPFGDFEAAIAAVDVCLNLRYPTAGETSASLLRILAVGRPAVVSDHGQAAALPEAAVIKIPLGDDEEEALVAQLPALLAAPSQLRAMGRAARGYVAAQHDPAAAAEAIVEACAGWQALPPADLRPRAWPAPTSLAWDRLRGSLQVTGAAAPWAAGERRQVEIRLVNGSAARWLAGERLGGGVAIEIQVFSGGRNLRAGQPWIGLPFDLEPGAEHRFTFDLRRPRGPAKLRIVPHVLDHTSFDDLGGPIWEAEI